MTHYSSSYTKLGFLLSKWMHPSFSLQICLGSNSVVPHYRSVLLESVKERHESRTVKSCLLGLQLRTLKAVLHPKKSLLALLNHGLLTFSPRKCSGKHCM